MPSTHSWFSPTLQIGNAWAPSKGERQRHEVEGKAMLIIDKEITFIMAVLILSTTIREGSFEVQTKTKK